MVKSNLPFAKSVIAQASPLTCSAAIETFFKRITHHV